MRAATPRPVVSGTTLRFVSLVAAVLGTSVYAFGSLYFLLPEHSATGLVTFLRCAEAYRHALPAPDADVDTYVAAAERARQGAIACMAPIDRPRAAWVLVGLLLLLTVAAALHLATPWWIRRRGRLVEITADGFPRLHAELIRLSTVAGLDRPPAFLLDPAAGAPGGLAFGRVGRYAVRINAGLVPLAVTDPGAFRAVVLHELAHLRNRDVDLTYAVVALWRAFVAVALVPLVVLTVYPPVLADPGRVPWAWDDVVDDYWPWDFVDYGTRMVQGSVRALLFVAVVYLARNAVLRARETYADARAADFGAGTDLRRVVATATGQPAPGWRRRLGRFGVHPTTAARMAAIDDPPHVHRPRFGELFVAGLTTMIAFTGLSHYAGIALPHAGPTGSRVAAWVIAPVVTAILGAVAWRAWQSPGSSADRIGRLVTATLGFSLGWLVGDLVSLTTPAGDWGFFGTSSTGGRAPLGAAPVMDGYGVDSALVAAVLLTGGMLAQAGVLAAAARTWSARGATGRWAWGAGAAVTAVPFALWITTWFDTRTVPSLVGHLYSIGSTDLARVGVDIWQGPGFALLTLFYAPLEIFGGRSLAVPALAVAWLYPLAAGLRPQWWRMPSPASPPRGGTPDSMPESLLTVATPAADQATGTAVDGRATGTAAPAADRATGIATPAHEPPAATARSVDDRPTGTAAAVDGRPAGAVPVAAAPSGPGPVHQDPASDDPRLGEGVRAALRVALLGAAGFAVALLAARAAIRLFAPERAGAADFSGYFYYCEIAAVTLVQAVVGGVLAARRRPLGLVLGQFAAMIVAVLATVAVVGAQTLGGCVAAFRLSRSTCAPPDDLPWALGLLRTLAVEGALAALLAGAAVVVASAVARRLPALVGVTGATGRRAWSATLLVLLLGVGGLAARGAYAFEEPTTVPTAAPRSSEPAPVPPGPAGPGRPLTSAEATAVVEAAERGLPALWQRKAEDEPDEDDPSDDDRYDPPGCRSLGIGAYQEKLEPQKRASAGANLTNGGNLASTTLYVGVTSYAAPVPESVLRDAERQQIGCPRFTVTSATGFQLAYEVHPASAPDLGGQAWRMDYDISTVSGPPIRGRLAEVTVRVDHSLVTVSMVAVGEPLDEALLTASLRRAVAALPR
ncbi:M48 family metalloprotease [Micromonospora coxensis]|uniref:Zn-dependent protease with chaperone function n=1 Tax=Micromonospora coxensis TaxID=356852 RepID=A0A1C5JN26_9ACTN|nr:M48 family metalloprotease [Micromonospora coxensis]SCG71970.1 Zn-dependent protease with chaperone function [Micromonospora coxensis]